MRGNPVTASLVLEHDDDALDRIAAYARDHDLFELESPPHDAPAKAPGIVIEHALARLDAWVRAETEGRSTLGSVVVMALVAGAVWQTARGQVLPAATQLVWFALSLAPPRTRQRIGRGEAVRTRAQSQLADVD